MIKKSLFLTLLACLLALTAQAEVNFYIDNVKLNDGESYSGSYLRSGSITRNGNVITFNNVDMLFDSSTDNDYIKIRKGYEDITIRLVGTNRITRKKKYSIFSLYGNQTTTITSDDGKGELILNSKNDTHYEGQGFAMQDGHTLNVENAKITISDAKWGIYSDNYYGDNKMVVNNATIDFKSNGTFADGLKTMQLKGCDFALPAGGRMQDGYVVYRNTDVPGVDSRWNGDIRIEPIGETYQVYAVGKQMNNLNSQNILGTYDSNQNSAPTFMYISRGTTGIPANTFFISGVEADFTPSNGIIDLLTTPLNIIVNGTNTFTFSADQSTAAIYGYGPINIQRASATAPCVLNIVYTGDEVVTNKPIAIRSQGDVLVDIDELHVKNKAGTYNGTNDPLFSRGIYAYNNSGSISPRLTFGNIKIAEFCCKNAAVYGFTGGVDLGDNVISAPEGGRVQKWDETVGYVIGADYQGTFSIWSHTIVQQKETWPVSIGGVTVSENTDFETAFSGIVKQGKIRVSKQTMDYNSSLGKTYTSFRITYEGNTVIDTRGTSLPAIGIDATGLTGTDKLALTFRASDDDSHLTLLSDADAIVATNVDGVLLTGIDIQSTAGCGIVVKEGADILLTGTTIKAAKQGIDGGGKAVLTAGPATIEAGAGGAVANLSDLQLLKDIYVSEPKGASFTEGSGTIRDRQYSIVNTVTFAQASQGVVINGKAIDTYEEFTDGLTSGYIRCSGSRVTFHNVHYEGELGIQLLHDMTATFEGENIIKVAHGTGIWLSSANEYWGCDYKFLTGDDGGSLRVEAADGAAVAAGQNSNLLLQLNTTLVGSTYGILGSGAASKLTVNSCRLSTYGRGDGSLCGFGQLELQDTEYTQPTDATYSDQAVRRGSTIVRSAVVISPVAPAITIDGQPLTQDNTAAFTHGVSHGTVSYDFTQRALVFHDVVAQWPQGIVVGQSISIKLEGSSDITVGADATALELPYLEGTDAIRYYNVELTGRDASLHLHGGKQGIHVSKTGILTLGSDIELTIEGSDYGISGLDTSHPEDTYNSSQLTVDEDIPYLEVRGSKGCISGFGNITWDLESARSAKFLSPTGCTVADGMVVDGDGSMVSGSLVYGVPRTLTIAGVTVTRSNAAKIPVKGGKASFDYATNTLTLDGATIEGNQGIYNDFGDDNLNIVLKGKNTIKATHTGIRSISYGIEISGDGSLAIEADSIMGLDGTSLSIYNTTLTGKGTFGIIGDGTNELHVYRADVNLTTTKAAIARIETTLALAKLENSNQEATADGVVDGDGILATGNVHITPLHNFVYLNDEVLTAQKARDLIAEGVVMSGSVDYNEATHTLTLDEVTWKRAPQIITDLTDLKIVGKGANELSSVLPLGSEARITLSGSGNFSVDGIFSVDLEMTLGTAGTVVIDNTTAEAMNVATVNGKLLIQNSTATLGTIVCGRRDGLHLKYTSLKKPEDYTWKSIWSTLDEEYRAIYGMYGFKTMYTYVDSDGKATTNIEFIPDPTNPDAVSAPAATDLRDALQLAGHTLRIGADLGTATVYTLSGQQVTSTATPTTIKLPGRGIYVVRTAKGSEKLLVK